MALKATFIDPETEEIRQVKIGFNWVLLLFSCAFGIPLFLRKLHGWACVFLALELIGWALNVMSSSGQIIWVPAFIVHVTILCLSLWMGLRGNELTAKNYLKLGWVLQNPTSKASIKAQKIWNLGPQGSSESAPKVSTAAPEADAV